MRAVDTNVLVRLIVRDDEKQVRRAEDFVAQGAWVSHIVVVETVWVLESVYSLSADRIAATIETLLGTRTFSFQEPEVLEEALGRFRRHPKVGFSDCVVAGVARKAGHTPLGTFDRNFAKLEGLAQL